MSGLAAVALATTALLLSSAAHADTGQNRIRAVEHGPAANSVPGATMVRIRGSQRPTFAVYTLQGPSRVVVDVAGAVLDDRITRSGGSMANWAVSGWAVSQVSAYEIHGQDDGKRTSRSDGRSLVRIVVDMARPGTYHAKADGRDVVVTVIPREPQPEGASPAEAARAAAAVREAEARRREVIAAIEDAEARRARVEKELHEAEEKRTRAEAAAAEAARRAEQARALREQEEAAHRDASTAREEAERRTAEAKRAGQRLAELETEAKTAKKQVASLRRAADEAARKAAKIEERKNATEREIARARAEAERLAKARAEAESELERRRREVARQASEAERLAKARAEAQAELASLDQAAAKVRREREQEEARVAELAKQRQELEREVERIRQRARAEAQAEREAQRAQAKAELASLDESAEKARRARKEEEARIAKLAKRRQELERELGQARRAAEAEREARRRKAEAELASLDGSAEKARRARKEEQTRIAELAKRRQELERELERMRAQARTAGKNGRETKRLAKARAQAEAELKSLDESAEKARRARKEEEARIAKLAKRRQKLERELTQAQTEAEAEREARRRKAEAELKSLDESAEKARRARKEEEARIAELAKRRQELERELAQAQAKAKAARDAAASAKAPAKASVKAPAKASAKTVAVQDVDFEDRNGVARVKIDLAADARMRVVSSKGKRAILEIDGVSLPAKLQRTLDIRPYRGPIQAISSYRHPKDRSRMRVVVDLAYPVKNALERDGTTYYWDFAKPAAAGSARAGVARNARGNRARTRAQSYPAPVVGGYGASSTPITQKTVAQLSNRGKKVYRGTKIDLDLKDVDIHNVMRLLADVGGINIVVPDDVKAKVTVRLRQVPWDQALEVVLASKGLWYRREGNLYRIAPRKQLDAEDQAEAERLAALVKSEAPEPRIFTLNYAVAGDIKTQLEPLLSPKGRIEVDDRTNSLIINDVRAHRDRIIALLTRLDTQTPQIQIEARIVEARSTFVRELGVQWGGKFSIQDGLLNPTGSGGATDNQTNFEGIALPPDVADPDFAVNLPAAVGSGAGGALGLLLGTASNFVALRLSALEDSGSVRIISAPKITVLNNVRAEISQGVSIPISVISAQGVQTQFVQADLALKVTPHVSQRDCSIAMEIEVAKNEADFVNTGARGDPTILRKEARTTVLVADNETTVLGGIYTRNSGLSYSKVPLLGDLPLLGWFFKNRRENDERTEVLVFVTPRITNKAFLRCE